jgi:hypothetical protein
MKTITTATQSFKRIKRITTHVGYGRFLAKLEDTNLEIPRTDLPSPYAYSPTHTVFNFDGMPVFIVETAHKTYDVFRVPDSVTPTRVPKEGDFNLADGEDTVR